MSERREISWLRTVFGNEVAEGDGFYVSFRPGSATLLAIWASDDGCDETALMNGRETLILNGDFRDAYASLIPLGYEACRAFYEQQAAHARSSWSSGSATALTLGAMLAGSYGYFCTLFWLMPT